MAVKNTKTNSQKDSRYYDSTFSEKFSFRWKVSNIRILARLTKVFVHKVRYLLWPSPLLKIAATHPSIIQFFCKIFFKYVSTISICTTTQVNSTFDISTVCIVHVFLSKKLKQDARLITIKPHLCQGGTPVFGESNFYCWIVKNVAFIFTKKKSKENQFRNSS